MNITTFWIYFCPINNQYALISGAVLLHGGLTSIIKAVVVLFPRRWPARSPETQYNEGPYRKSFFFGPVHNVLITLFVQPPHISSEHPTVTQSLSCGLCSIFCPPNKDLKNVRPAGLICSIYSLNYESSDFNGQFFCSLHGFCCNSRLEFRFFLFDQLAT